MQVESYTRQQIFDLLWTEPATKVALRIGFSDVALGKWCKLYKVPKPPVGYWTKLEKGKSVIEKPRLEPWWNDSEPKLNVRQKDKAWWVQADGQVVDPYDSLKELAREMIGDEGLNALAREEIEIAEGGAAAMAYGRLQFEDLTIQDRRQIQDALLRYCELDTLAMVMIVEAWREWCR